MKEVNYWPLFAVPMLLHLTDIPVALSCLTPRSRGDLRGDRRGGRDSIARGCDAEAEIPRAKD